MTDSKMLPQELAKKEHSLTPLLIASLSSYTFIVLCMVCVSPVLLWQALWISAAPMLSSLNVTDSKYEESFLTLNKYLIPRRAL